MTIQWNYPIYLIAHSGGYASIVDPTSKSEPPLQQLVVISEETLALQFMGDFGIMGAPRMLNNDREFGWLLQSLKPPVTSIAFDPNPVEKEINAAWACSIDTMLEKHLSMDNSPWNYPVYFINQDTGYSSILGQSADGKDVIVLNLFTTKEKANEFLKAADEPGDLEEYADMASLREFLDSMQKSGSAIAIDPEITETGRTAKNCLGIESLLAKYLVSDAAE
ncbi:MAG: hypothetical protein COA78_31705 [Blastopirellula sp.]|nr:MAG: hypothetical protein COA78_31705 [Blastopirellula sp.]